MQIRVMGTDIKSIEKSIGKSIDDTEYGPLGLLQQLSAVPMTGAAAR